MPRLHSFGPFHSFQRQQRIFAGWILFLSFFSTLYLVLHQRIAVQEETPIPLHMSQKYERQSDSKSSLGDDPNEKQQARQDGPQQQQVEEVTLQAKEQTKQQTNPKMIQRKEQRENLDMPTTSELHNVIPQTAHPQPPTDPKTTDSSRNKIILLANDTAKHTARPSPSNTTTTQKLKRQLPKTVLFFHIFINPNNQSLSWNIVQEMLESRQQYPHIRYSSLHYVTIGGGPEASKETTKIPSHLCEPCRHMGHFDRGFEDITLGKLYRHCHSHPMDRVVYFHNKGSFNSKPKNHRLRQHLVRGIFSEACHDVVSNGSYNFCCSKFKGFPAAYCLGNMFVTSCEYVKKLHAPVAFGRLRREIHEDMKNQTEKEDVAVFWINNNGLDRQSEPLSFEMRSRQKKRFVSSQDTWLGLGRYGAEHWAGSHPLLRPIDVCPRDLMLEYGQVPFNFSWEPRPSVKFKIYSDHQKCAIPFFRLEGRLYLYERLYGVLPPNSSWVWDYYYLAD